MLGYVYTIMTRHQNARAKNQPAESADAGSQAEGLHLLARMIARAIYTRSRPSEVDAGADSAVSPIISNCSKSNKNVKRENLS